MAIFTSNNPWRASHCVWALSLTASLCAGMAHAGTVEVLVLDKEGKPVADAVVIVVAIIVGLGAAARTASIFAAVGPPSAAGKGVSPDESRDVPQA